MPHWESETYSKATIAHRDAWPIRVATGLALFGLAFSTVVFYPGIFTPDSLEQFAQAHSGEYEDWHPPIMAALWSLLLHIHDGPEPLLFVHLFLFWGGLCAVSDALIAKGARWAAFLPLVGLGPFIFNYLGLLWKDVALASSWLFAAGVAFRGFARHSRLGWFEYVAISLAFMYGALARGNSIFAAAPLALYFLNADVLSRRVWPQIAACILVPALLLTSASVFNGRILQAEAQHPEDSLFLFDIIGVSHQMHTNLVPGAWAPAQARQIPDCYAPDKWDHVGMGRCQFVTQALDSQNLWGAPAISRAWLRAIAQHPGQYVAHRLAFSNQMMRWLGPIPVQDSFMQSEMTDHRFMHHPNSAFKFYEALSVALSSTPLFRPYFWLLLSGSILLLSVFAIDSLQRRFATAIGASAFIYLATYVLFGVASDFRYAYWTIMGVCVALAALIACSWRAPRQALIAAYGCASVIAVAIAASLAL